MRSNEVAPTNPYASVFSKITLTSSGGIDGPSLYQENNVRVDLPARFYDLLGPFNGKVHIHRCTNNTNSTSYGYPHMGYDGIGTSLF